ncbi:hypothetical protein GCM10018966_002760 [Streptomyces yanii]
MVVGVPGCGDHLDPQLPGPQSVAVADPDGVEAKRRPGWHRVRRLTAAGELQTACHIVVVQVGLHDRVEPQAAVLEHTGDALQVTLRVHCDRDRPVCDQVAAVPEAERGDLDDLQAIGQPLGEPQLGLGGPARLGRDRHLRDTTRRERPQHPVPRRHVEAEFPDRGGDYLTDELPCRIEQPDPDARGRPVGGLDAAGHDGSGGGFGIHGCRGHL